MKRSCEAWMIFDSLKNGQPTETLVKVDENTPYQKQLDVFPITTNPADIETDLFIKKVTITWEE